MKSNSRMSLRLVNCTVEDAELVTEMGEALQDSARAFGAGCIVFVEGAYRETPSTVLNFEKPYYIAEYDGQSAGYVQYCFQQYGDEKILYIRELFVKPEFRRRGLATYMLDSCEEIARAEGCSQMQLSVLSGNTAAEALYSKFGLMPIKTVRGFRL